MNTIEPPWHDPKWDQSLGEELANSVSLGLGFPPISLAWLAAGGIAYTGGVFFFVIKRTRYTHFVWHLFVLLGTACHFLAIFSCTAG